jgi:hypothetical protein
MRLADLPAALLDDTLRKLRRRAIAGIVVAACVLAAVIEGTSAARHALESATGPVSARLIVAAAFVAIAAVAVGLLIWAERRSARATAQARAARGEDDPRAALIAEAVSLGYSIGRDFMKASANGHAAAADDASAKTERTARRHRAETADEARPPD